MKRSRRHYGHASGHGRAYQGAFTPWAGTDYIERRFNAVQPRLARAAFGMSKGEVAREDIARGSEVLTWLLSMRPGPTVQSRRYTAHKIGEREGHAEPFPKRMR